MSHSRKGKHLSRPLLQSFIRHGRLTTTSARASALSREIDRLVSLAKKKTPSSLRRVKQIVNNQELIGRLMNLVVPNFTDRESGFTRKLLVEPRRGDRAEMALLEWVKPIASDERYIRKKQKQTKKGKVRKRKGKMSREQPSKTA